MHIGFPTTGLLLAALLGLLPTVRAASPFANFEGTFSRQGRVQISGGDDVAGSGRITQRFSLSADGESARLTIAGFLTLRGARRDFSTTYIFRRPDQEGARVAAVTNLAPGIDSGYAAAEGSYVVTPRSIRAEIPFVIGTTQGTATLVLRLKDRPRTTQLITFQTLATNTLLDPVIWTFKGLDQP